MPRLKTAEISDEASSGAAAAPMRMRFCTPITVMLPTVQTSPMPTTPIGHHQGVPSQATSEAGGEHADRCAVRLPTG